MDLSNIRRIAGEVRRERELMEGTPRPGFPKREGECPRGVCIDWTIALVEYLRDYGYPAVRVYGAIHPDGYWDEDDNPVFAPESWEQDWANHNWAMIGDVVVDISADQFNSLLKRGKFPKIFVQPLSKARRHEPLEVLRSKKWEAYADYARSLASIRRM